MGAGGFAMTASLIVIELAGAVALLLWATRMVQTGVQRAFGHVLKDVMRRALATGPGAAVAGGVLAMALQSATAVAVIVTGFVGAGLVPVARGIAALLGADLGSALVALVLQLDLSVLMPLFLLAGLMLYRRAATAQGAAQAKEIGKILFGVGLLLLSLRLIGQAAAPLRDSAVLPSVLGYLVDDRLSAFALAAAFTLLVHSSIAAVLVLAMMAQQGVVPLPLILPLVLGLNAGASLIPWYLTRGQEHPARLVPLANLILRGGGAGLALGAVMIWRPDDWSLVAGGGAAVVGAHVAFNTALLVAGIGLSGMLARGLGALLAPVQGAAGGPPPQRRSALNDLDLAMPSVALSNAQREMMILCDRIESMLAQVPALYETPRPEALSQLRGLDDEVDALHTAIKLYVSRIPADAMDRTEAARADEILGATIKLEQVADIVTRNLAVKAEKKAARGVDFSRKGWREISDIHAEVLANTRRAYAVLLSGDVEMARQLVRGKEQIRALEQASETAHLQRLRAGDVQARETSTLHMDTIRDLKEINSLLVAITYPILERAGMLGASRLV